MFTLNEVEFGSFCGRVTLWFVQGRPLAYYPTKIVAEAAARHYFPDDDVYTRQARVRYHEFCLEDLT